jgi:hypothetical protein
MRQKVQISGAYPVKSPAIGVAQWRNSLCYNARF